MNVTTRLKQAAKSAMIAANQTLLRPALLKHPQVKQALMMLPARLRKSVLLSTTVYSDTVSIYVTMHDLSSFKDLRLQRLIERFDTWECATHDYMYDKPNRDFTFTKKIAWTPTEPKRAVSFLQSVYVLPQTFNIQMTIAAYVKADSDACRIEVVGIEETVERKEIKRIVCA